MSDSQLAPEERASLRPWAIAMVSFFAIFATLLAVDLRDATWCRGDALQTVAVPATWPSFALLPNLGGFEILSQRGGCVGHGMQCGMIDTELRDAHVCPREGVSLDAYFDGDIYQSATDIALRESAGTFVATSHSSMTPNATESPVVAFRRAPHGARLTFAHAQSAALAVAFSSMTSLLVVAGAISYRAARRQSHDVAGTFARVATLVAALALLGVLANVAWRWLGTIAIS